MADNFDAFPVVNGPQKPPAAAVPDTVGFDAFPLADEAPQALPETTKGAAQAAVQSVPGAEEAAQSPNPEKDRGIFGTMLADQVETMFGIPANPFDEKGEPKFKILGDLAQLDSGDFAITPDGEQVAISSQDFVARDPRDGKLKVMMLPEQTVRNRLDQFARLVTGGMIAGAPTRLAKGGLQASRNVSAATQDAARSTEQASRAAAAARQGVDASLPTISGSRVAQGAAATLREVPGASPVIERGIQREVGQVAEGIERTAQGFGEAAERAQAGRSVRQGLEDFRASAGRDFDLRSVDSAELSTFIAQPSRRSSFSRKAAALYERVGRIVPAGARALPGNTLRTLEDIGGRFNNPQLQGQFENPFFERLRAAIQGPQTWRDLRQLRSEVRQLKANTLSDAERTVSNADIKRLEAALTQDILALTENTAGPRGVKALRDADKFYRAGIDRLDRAKKLLKVDSDEKLYDRVISMASEAGQANIKMLNAMRRSVGDLAWQDMAAVALRRMGEPTAGARDAAVQTSVGSFSPSTFVTNFNKLSPQGRRVLFASTGRADLSRALDDLAEVATGQKQSARFSVPTGGGVGIGRAAGVGLITQMLSGLDGFATAAATMLGGNVAARIMMSPRVVRAWTGLLRARQGPEPGRSMPIAINRLQLALNQDKALAPLAERLSQILDSEGEVIAEPAQPEQQ